MLRRRVAVIAALAMLVVAAPALALVRDRPANPGSSGNAPGQQGGGAPGNSGNAPGQQASGAPGSSGSAPGQQGDAAPGSSGEAPGQQGDGAPGNSGNAPGQQGDGAPGNSGNAPGQQGDGAPGNSGNAPGQSDEAPPADAPAAEPDPELLPKPGRPAAVAEAVVTRPTRGTVLVKTPGMEAKVALGEAAQVPVGSKVDAREGEVVVRTALPNGGTQAITLAGSKFVLRQEPTGMTSIVLRGGDFSVCEASAPVASAASARGGKGKRRKGVRRLFAADDDGKFRTHGANSVATVRGTEWITVDRCDGTLTIVREGSVVVHDETRDRDVVVRAGERYLARAPR